MTVICSISYKLGKIFDITEKILNTIYHHIFLIQTNTNMATIRVKLRESAVPGKAGTIFYQLSHKQHVKQITTKIYILPEHWDKVKERVIISFANDETYLYKLQRQIEIELSILNHIILDFTAIRKEYSVHDIIDAFYNFPNRDTVLDFIKKQIDYLLGSNRIGTARNYRRTLNSFSSFLIHSDIPFAVLDEQLVTDYSNWLRRRGVTRNTISFYMRILRSVYNKAVRQKITVQTFPFQNVYTGVDKTRKRATNENTIIRLKKLDLSQSPPLSLARDLFIFSYCARGMAFVDMAFLTKKNISNGNIHYIRRKTGQSLSIKIETYMQEIISRYTLQTLYTPYIFPLITSEEETKAYMQYQNALRYYNQQLKRLSNMLDLDIPLTSYTSRHTWATSARKHNVPLSVISAGMGHNSEKTTEIYLATLENSVIDQANHDIISFLNE